MKTNEEEAMTSHHDVAVVVAELRHSVGERSIYRTDKTLVEAADLLESQAKALSEAEANFAKLSEMALESELLRDRALTSGEAWKARALAAEARLAELDDYIKGWTSPSTMRQRAGEMTAQEVRTVQAVLSAVLDKARAFTNAAKTQESKDA